MTGGGPWGSTNVLAYKMYEDSLFNFRMGYDIHSSSTIHFDDIYIACFCIDYLSASTENNVLTPIQKYSIPANILYRVALIVTLFIQCPYSCTLTSIRTYDDILRVIIGFKRHCN